MEINIINKLDLKQFKKYICYEKQGTLKSFKNKTVELVIKLVKIVEFIKSVKA
jgi:hypothetical protein